MRYLFAIFTSLLFLNSQALGQSTPAAKEIVSKPAQTKAQSKTSDTDKLPAKKTKALESYFKAGEKQLKENGRCKSPPVPVA